MTETTFPDEDKEKALLDAFDEHDESIYSPTLVNLLEKFGLQESQISRILLGILLISSVGVFLFTLHQNILPKVKPRATYIEDIPLELRQRLPPDTFSDLPSRNTNVKK